MSGWIKAFLAAATGILVAVLIAKGIFYYPKGSAITAGAVGFIGLVMWLKLLVFPDDGDM